MVEILLHLAQVFLPFALDVAVDVGLLTALVVGIGVLHASARCPFVVVSPSVGVVDVALLRVNLIQCHQAFVIHSPCPKVTCPRLVYVSVKGWVTVLLHEVVVGSLHYIQYLLLFRVLRHCLSCKTKCANCNAD